MKFHLVYRGHLSSSGNSPKPKEALAIREQLSAQMEYLWAVNGPLQELKYSALVAPRDSSIRTTLDSPLMTAKEHYERTPQRVRDQLINLCDPVCFEKYEYVPLVRKSLEINCSLKILFLRQEDPGNLISQAGDIDNRIKTLLDGLKVPDKANHDKFSPILNKTYCLLESDFLVANLDIETDRLLFPETDKENEVHLVIEVSIHVLRAGAWNLCLL